MMGANWRPDPEETIHEKFAWFPVKTNSNKRIWLKKYVEVEVYMDGALSHPIKSNTWKFVYTTNEWLVKKLKGA